MQFFLKIFNIGKFPNLEVSEISVHVFLKNSSEEQSKEEKVYIAKSNLHFNKQINKTYKLNKSSPKENIFWHFRFFKNSIEDWDLTCYSKFSNHPIHCYKFMLGPPSDSFLFLWLSFDLCRLVQSSEASFLKFSITPFSIIFSLSSSKITLFYILSKLISFPFHSTGRLKKLCGTLILVTSKLGNWDINLQET